MKMPMLVAAPTSMIRSQKLSWMAGQWYLTPTRRTTTSVSVLMVEAIFVKLLLCSCVLSGYVFVAAINSMHRIFFVSVLCKVSLFARKQTETKEALRRGWVCGGGGGGGTQR